MLHPQKCIFLLFWFKIKNRSSLNTFMYRDSSHLIDWRWSVSHNVDNSDPVAFLPSWIFTFQEHRPGSFNFFLCSQETTSGPACPLTPTSHSMHYLFELIPFNLSELHRSNYRSWSSGSLSAQQVWLQWWSRRLTAISADTLTALFQGSPPQFSRCHPWTSALNA